MTDWASTEPCVTCDHPYSEHVSGSGCTITDCECKLFMAAHHPEDPRSVGNANPESAVALGQAIEEHRQVFSLVLSYWHTLPDDPATVAKMLVEVGLSPTQIAENLQLASRDMQAITEALSDEGTEQVGR